MIVVCMILSSIALGRPINPSMKHRSLGRAPRHVVFRTDILTIGMVTKVSIGDYMYTGRTTRVVTQRPSSRKHDYGNHGVDI